MKRRILSLLTLSVFSIAQAEGLGNNESDQKKFDQAVDVMLLELQNSQDMANKALETGDTATYSLYQCKILNNLEDIIKYSGSHLQLKGASKMKANYGDRLKQELAPFKMANITKKDICLAAGGLPEDPDMLPTNLYSID